MLHIVHEAPAAPGEQNLIVQVELAPYGFPDLAEQLWLAELPEGGHAVACLPFRVYGLALGDRVAVSAGGGRIDRLVRPSGHDVFRLFLLPEHRLHAERARVVAELDRTGLLAEWSGEWHLAVDVPPGADLDGLLELIAPQVGAGRMYQEWAGVQPFVAQQSGPDSSQDFGPDS